MHHEVQIPMYIAHATPAQIQKREACDKFPEDQGYRIPETGETAIIQCKESGQVSSIMGSE